MSSWRRAIVGLAACAVVFAVAQGGSAAASGWRGGTATGEGARAEVGGTFEYAPSLRAANAPACTRRALTKGLHHSGLRGYVDRAAFGCAGSFAYAGVIVDRNEVTVLFRAVDRDWHAVSRIRYCENGSIPKQIYQPACESN